MIYKEHYIELYINGQKLDLQSQRSLNLRFNNVLYDPEKIASTQAEYSFSFEIPSTPNNDKIFDYSNNLSKLNKFHQRWDAEVYADGTLIFSGSLTLNGFKNKMYQCNLVSVKTYSLDDIFGESVMYDISGVNEETGWYINFNGVDSINTYNSFQDPTVMFPLTSYGVFQKTPYRADSVANDYTSKYNLDQYNKWYVESFYPSLNMLATLKRAFEYKDYTVGGDAFDDYNLKDIFMSVNLADGQSPDYNLGNPRFGKVDLTINWRNPSDSEYISHGTVQDLKFPYLKSGNKYWDFANGGIEVDPDYNLNAVRIYDMMSSTEGGTVTVNESTYMFEPNEHLIVIPSTGFYKIDMSITGVLETTTSITASQLVHDWSSALTSMTLSVSEKDITFASDFKVTTPLEIQLVRNYNEDIELIRGKNQIRIHDGYPDNTTEMNQGRYNNIDNYISNYPHEKLGYLLATDIFYPIPTVKIEDYNYYSLESKIGYMYGNGDLMAYDPVVNKNFICGFTSMGNKTNGGCASVIKNGYSWSRTTAERNYSFYTQPGYYDVTTVSDTDWTNFVYQPTTYNQNTYIDSPSQVFYQTNGNFVTKPRMIGRITCMVYLEKNDVIGLYGVHRDYKTTAGTSVSYDTSATVRLTVQAASPKTYAELMNSNFGYNSQSDFDTKLRLSNFLNKEKKVSEWVQNIADAFNLDIIQNGKTVTINKRRKIDFNMPIAVDIDDRVNSANIESSAIDYPKSMAVKYKIDTDEWGFERSAVASQGGDESILNDPNWVKYGDSGYTVVELNDDSYVTTKSDKNLQFSYTWYDNFTWFPVNSRHQETSGDTQVLTIPVISKYSYMIDGYDYDESMKHDGYGLAQRFWFKPSATNTYLWTNTHPAERVDIYTTSNVKDGLNLSYKANEISLLSKYFNITPYLASNYITMEAYLSPEEYKSIKNGCLVRVDSDLYYPVEIQGYDASGNNPATLKLMKKI